MMDDYCLASWRTTVCEWGGDKALRMSDCVELKQSFHRAGALRLELGQHIYMGSVRNGWLFSGSHPGNGETPWVRHLTWLL